MTTRADLALWVCGAFIFSGLMFGPDLDLHSIQYKRWGILRGIWHPYQRWLRHRSILSHGPIVGTIFRVIYLGVWLGGIGIFLLGLIQFITGRAYDGKQIIAIVLQYLDRHRLVCVAIFIGLELGAMSHYLSDWLVSSYKRMNKPPAKPTSRAVPMHPEPRKPKTESRRPFL
jgi:uncharacterized metal-binding protein